MEKVGKGLEPAGDGYDGAASLVGGDVDRDTQDRGVLRDELFHDRFEPTRDLSGARWLRGECCGWVGERDQPV